MYKALGLIPRITSSSIVMCDHNPRTQVKVQGHSWLHSKFEVRRKKALANGVEKIKKY